MEAISQDTDSFTFAWERNESRTILGWTDWCHQVSALEGTLTITGQLFTGTAVIPFSTVETVGGKYRTGGARRSVAIGPGGEPNCSWYFIVG